MADEETRTIEAYTAHFNSKLEAAGAKTATGTPLRITNLIDDLADGSILVELMAAMFNTKVPRYTKKPRMDFHRLENLSIGLDLATRNKLKATAAAEDFLNKNRKVVLGFLWQLLLTTSAGSSEFRKPWAWAEDILKKKQEEAAARDEEARATKQAELDLRKEEAQKRIAERQRAEDEAKRKAEEAARQRREDANKRRQAAVGSGSKDTVAIILADPNDALAEHIAREFEAKGATNVVFITPAKSDLRLPNQRVCNATDPDALAKVLQESGVTRVAFTNPEQAAAIAEAGKKVGLQHVVKTGPIGSDKRRNELMAAHDDAENILKATELPVAFVHTAPLMSTFARLAAGGEVALPTSAAIPWLDPTDASSAIVNVVLDNETAGMNFNIAGPEALTPDQVIEKAAAGSEEEPSAGKKRLVKRGRKKTNEGAAEDDSIGGADSAGGRLKNLTEDTEADLLAALNKRMRLMKAKAMAPAEMREALIAQGLSPKEADTLVQTLADFSADDIPDNDAEALCATPPKSMTDFAKSNPGGLAKPNKVLVIGADDEEGKGLALAKELRKDGVPVRVGVRSAASPQAEALAKLGCEVVECDPTKLASVGRACDSVDKVVLLHDARPTLPQEAKVAAAVAAKLPNIAHLVVTSTLGADERANPVQEWHDDVEKILDDCPKPVTFVRCAPTTQAFADGVCPDLRESGPGYTPTPEPNKARVPYIHPKDIGKALARVTSAPGTEHINTTYTLTGPKALTAQEAMQQLAEGSGIPPTEIKPCTAAEFAEKLEERGVPADVAAARARQFATLGTTPQTSEVSGDFATLIGQPPRSVQEYAGENPEKFTPPETIAVLQADDPVGLEAVKALIKPGLPGSAPPRVRACVRSMESPEAKAFLHMPGVEVVPVDAADVNTLPPALSGASKVLLIQDDSPDMAEQARNVAAAAKAAGCQHITRVGAAATPQQTDLAKWHDLAEKALKDSGIPTTLVRTTPLMSTASAGLALPDLDESGPGRDDTNKPQTQGTKAKGPGPLKEGSTPGDPTLKPSGNPHGNPNKPTKATVRKMALPMGQDGKVAFISPQDAGKAAATAAMRDDTVGKTYTISGPEALTGAELARQISEAAGVPVQFADVPPESSPAVTSVSRAGMPNPQGTGSKGPDPLQEASAPGDPTMRPGGNPKPVPPGGSQPGGPNDFPLEEGSMPSDDSRRPGGNPSLNRLPPAKARKVALAQQQAIAAFAKAKDQAPTNDFENLTGEKPHTFRKFAQAEGQQNAVLQNVPTVLVTNPDTPMGQAVIDALNESGIPWVPGAPTQEGLKQQMIDNQVDKVIVTEPDSPDLPKRVKAIADAAKEANVSHVVKVGVMDSPDRRTQIACWHDDAEKVLKDSGIPTTNVRSAPTFDELLAPSQATLKHPKKPVLQVLNKNAVAWVDRQDVANAVANVVLKETPLTGDDTAKPSGRPGANPGGNPGDLNEGSMPGDTTRGPTGNPGPKPGKPNVYNVTGSEALKPAQVAKMLSSADRPVEVAVVEHIPSNTLSPGGTSVDSTPIREAREERLKDLPNDSSCFPSNDLERLTGQKPRSARDLAREQGAEATNPKSPLVLNADDPTGVGEETVRALAKGGKPVIAGVSSLKSPEAARLAAIGPNVDVRVIDPTKPEELLQNLVDADTVINISEDTPAARKSARAIANAAREAGVSRIINVGDDHNDKEDNPVAAANAEAERLLEDSGVPTTFVRAGPTTTKLMRDSEQSLQESGVLKLPKFKKLAVCDPRDVAEAAAKCATNPHTQGKTFRVHGQAPMTGQQIAQALSQATGQPIKFEEMTPEEAKNALAEAGLPDAEARLEQYKNWGEIAAKEPPNDFQVLTGKKPRGIDRTDVANATLDILPPEGTVGGDDTSRPGGRPGKAPRAGGPKGGPNEKLNEGPNPQDPTKEPFGGPKPVPPKRVAIIGADDIAGVQAARELAEHSPVVAGVLDPLSPIAQQLASIPNVTVKKVSPNDEASLSELLKDAETVIWNPLDEPTIVDQAKKIRKVAEANNVAHIVKVGVVGSDERNHPLAIWHDDAEKELDKFQPPAQESGPGRDDTNAPNNQNIPGGKYPGPREHPMPGEETLKPMGNPKPVKGTTHIRTSCPMTAISDVAGSLSETPGEVQLPMGGSRQAFIDPRDIGTATAAAVLDPTTKGDTFNVTGKQALGGDQVAASLARSLQKPVSFNDVDDTVAEDRLVDAGVPQDVEGGPGGDDTSKPAGAGKPGKPGLNEHPQPGDDTRKPGGNPDKNPALAQVKRFTCPRDDEDAATGAMAVPTKDFRRLVGRDPHSLAEFAKEFPEQFEEPKEHRLAVIADRSDEAKAAKEKKPKKDINDIPTDKGQSQKRFFAPPVEVEISKDPDGNHVDGEFDPWHSGGNHDFSTWRTNPQFKIKVDEPMSINITLSQKKDPPEEYIGWHVVENTDGSYVADVSPSHRVITQTRDVARKGQSHQLAKSVGGVCPMEPGRTYFLVPSTFYQGKISPFKFDILRDGHNYDTQGENDGIRIWRVKEPRQYAYTLDIRGDWTPENCMGGRASPLWRKNPQFKFCIGDVAKRTPAHITAIISRAEQKVGATEGQENDDEDYKVDIVADKLAGYAIGVNLVKNRSVHFPDFVLPNYEALGQHEERWTHITAAEVAAHLTIPVDEFNDTFFVVPSMSQPGVELPFICTIHSDCPISVSRVGPEEGEGCAVAGDDKANVPPGYNSASVEGAWTADNSGGHFIPSKPDGFRKNPQYILETDSESPIPVSVIISQSGARGKLNHIAVHAIRNADPEDVSSVKPNFKIVSRSMFTAEHTYGEAPELSAEVNISKRSPILIVPSTFQAGTAGNFKLVALGKGAPVRLRPVDTSSAQAAEAAAASARKTLDGEWLKGQSSGGNASMSTYRNNPTYRIANQTGSPQTVKLSLERTGGTATIGLAVVKNKPGKAHRAAFAGSIVLPEFEDVAVFELAQGGKTFKYTKGDTAVLRATVPANGTVFAIPSTGNKGETGHFKLSIEPESGDANAIQFGPINMKPVASFKDKLPAGIKGDGDSIINNPFYTVKVSKPSALAGIFRRDDDLEFAFGLALVQNSAANEKEGRPAKGHTVLAQITDVVDGEETEYVSEPEGHFTVEVQPGTYYLVPRMIPLDEEEETMDFGTWEVQLFSNTGNVIVTKG